MNPSEDEVDLAIVGGGAAGLALAILTAQRMRAAAAGSRPPRIVIFDTARQLGAKILVAGGGRCNVTHQYIEAADYFGNPRLIGRVLARFDHLAARQWFERMGVALKVEPTGKLFPRTDKARTVLDALLDSCRKLHIEIRTGTRIVSIRQSAHTQGDAKLLLHAEDNGRERSLPGGPVAARFVALCTGGRSLPRTGSDGGGYQLARSLGHTITTTAPGLVPLVLDPEFFHARLSGITIQARLRVRPSDGGRPTFDRHGSLLFTHFGISGPLAMDASRIWTLRQEAGHPPRITLALLPEMDEAGTSQWLRDHPGVSGAAKIPQLLESRLPRRLVVELLTFLSINGGTRLSELDRATRQRLAEALTSLTLPVRGPRGWNYAEVTAGGVPLEEVDIGTMASRCCPNLYLAGEILDCDGRIGGFNFQWAWATAAIAAQSLARKLAALPDSAT
ncbi:MAG: aminoacetone oxidase family FAD-binding enzyme [Phycisphaeraceae bacterium]|nr:aminoacetone oxidase family FAD-binding enzyme [Phycisphaeraceae bacterium]